MAKTVKLRFYGRFLYAVAHDGDTPTGRIDIIAPSFDQTRFAQHHVHMTVRRDQLSLHPQATTISPTLRLVTGAPQILDAELLTWDITGFNVSFPNADAPSATLDAGDETRGQVLDLGVLHRLIQREAHFDSSALQAQPGGKSRAVIEVTKGTGKALPVFPRDDHGTLVPVGNARIDRDAHVVTSKTTASGDFLLNDLVEFTLALPDGDTELAFDLRARDGDDGVITVLAGSVNDTELDPDGNLADANDTARRQTDEVVVSFSHICSSRPRRDKYDFEFTQYYDLLRQNPGDQALILRPSQSAGEGGNCIYQAAMRYDRTAENKLKS